MSHPVAPPASISAKQGTLADVERIAPPSPATQADPAYGRASIWQELLFGLLANALSVGLLSLIFQPISYYWLTLVSLLPWCYAACVSRRPWLAYPLGYLAGFAFFLINLRWLWPVTELGYVALAAYLGVYFPLAAWALRTGRRAGIAVVWTLPVAWVATEFLRGWVMTGFPWLFLSHAMQPVTLLIQIADLVGSYGVTFLMLLPCGLLTEALIRWRRERVGVRAFPRQLWAGAAATVAAFAGCAAYGAWRLGQTDAISPGPRVTAVQHDFVMLSTPTRGSYRQTHQELIFAEYLALAARAVEADQPDLLAFPETVWSSYQNISFLKTPLKALDEVKPNAYAYGQKTHRSTSAFAQGYYLPVNEAISGWEQTFREWASRRPDYQIPTQFPRLPPAGRPTAVLVGSISLDPLPGSSYPRQRKYNSALLYTHEGIQLEERYDKIHLVPFGEYVPFQNQRVLGIDLHPLYRWLNSLSPFSDGGKIEYSLSRGQNLTVFPLPVGERTWRFGTPICYEDAVAYLCRDYVWGDDGQRRVDFLVNISNDGWFLHSAELPQHLAICAMRAVENRVGIIRAVNTGMSAVIDSNGRIVQSLAPRQIGWVTAAVPIDSRVSFYGRTGDWMALTCVALATCLWVSGVTTRWLAGIYKFGRRLLRRAKRAVRPA